MHYDPEQFHQFYTSINGVNHSDTTVYNDREFQMIADRYNGMLPLNLNVCHFRGSPESPRASQLQELPQIPIPVYELSWDNNRTCVAEGLKLYRRNGPKSGKPIRRRHMNFVLAQSTASSGRLAFIDGKECSLLSRYTASPISLKDANLYISYLHRHNSGVQGHKFSIALSSVEERIVGVLIVGRPISRHQDDGSTLEIRRTCCDERYHNVNSALMGKAIRIGKELGYRRFLSYTLLSEKGNSLTAVGFKKAGIAPGHQSKYAWNSSFRPRSKPDKYPHGDKQRWVLDLAA